MGDNLVHPFLGAYSGPFEAFGTHYNRSCTIRGDLACWPVMSDSSSISASGRCAPVAPSLRSNQTRVNGAYKRMCSVYDLIFGGLFRHGQRMVAREIDRDGAKEVLEIGVGTGLSLEHYPEHITVCGVDPSPEMLKRARKRAGALGRERDHFHLASGEKLDFPDGHFSAVVLSHVVSVVPDVAALMKELERVTSPGGAVWVLNHFSTNPLWKLLDKTLGPKLLCLCGFWPYFPRDAFLKKTSLHLEKAVRLWRFPRNEMLRLRKPA